MAGLRKLSNRTVDQMEHRTVSSRDLPKHGGRLQVLQLKPSAPPQGIASMRSTSCPRLTLSYFRLLVWYTIITSLFRCPSSFSELTETSPQVCKPFLTAKGYINPYLQPYYKTYAGPYVDVARPYAQTFESKVFRPSVKYGTKTYKTYGAPRVEQARVFGVQQWDKTLRPQLNEAQVQAKKLYRSSLAPLVDKFSSVFDPYYCSGRNIVTTAYQNYILPTYTTSRPYAEKAYSAAHTAAVETGLPYVQAAWKSTVNFVIRILWPKLRILYGENVEPQLVRIGERLGRYRDGRKIQSAMEGIDRYVHLPWLS